MQKKTKDILRKIYKVCLFFALVAGIVWINAEKLDDDTLSNYEKITDAGIHDDNYYNSNITPVIAALFYYDENTKLGFNSNPDIYAQHKITTEDIRMAILPKTVNALNTPVIEKLYDEIPDKERFKNIVLVYNSAKNARSHNRIIKRRFPNSRTIKLMIDKEQNVMLQDALDNYLKSYNTLVVFLANLDRGLNSKKSEKLANEAVFYAQKYNYQMNVFDVVDEYVAAAMKSGEEFAYAVDIENNTDILSRQKENLDRYVLANRRVLLYYFAHNMELAMQDAKLDIPQKNNKNYRLFDQGNLYIKVFNKDYNLVFEELKLQKDEGIVVTLSKMAEDVVKSKHGMSGKYNRIYLLTEMESLPSESNAVLANYLEPDDGIYASYKKNAGLLLADERPDDAEMMMAKLREAAKIKDNVDNADISFFRFKYTEMQYDN